MEDKCGRKQTFNVNVATGRVKNERDPKPCTNTNPATSERNPRHAGERPAQWINYYYYYYYYYLVSTQRKYMQLFQIFTR